MTTRAIHRFPRLAARTFTRASLFALLLVSGACIRRHRDGGDARASAWRAWPETLAQARRLAAGGAYARADTVLAQFEREWGAAPEAEESRYWRAILMLDPSNTQATTANAIVMIDRYLETAPTGARRAELELIRRVATLVQALRSDSQALRAAQGETKARDDELAKLREELARTQAELERVRNRVIRRSP